MVAPMFICRVTLEELAVSPLSNKTSMIAHFGQLTRSLVATLRPREQAPYLAPTEMVTEGYPTKLPVVHHSASRVCRLELSAMLDCGKWFSNHCQAFPPVPGFTHTHRCARPKDHLMWRSLHELFTVLRFWDNPIKATFPDHVSLEIGDGTCAVIFRPKEGMLYLLSKRQQGANLEDSGIHSIVPGRSPTERVGLGNLE